MVGFFRRVLAIFSTGWKDKKLTADS